MSARSRWSIGYLAARCAALKRRASPLSHSCCDRSLSDCCPARPLLQCFRTTRDPAPGILGAACAAEPLLVWPARIAIVTLRSPSHLARNSFIFASFVTGGLGEWWDTSGASLPIGRVASDDPTREESAPGHQHFSLRGEYSYASGQVASAHSSARNRASVARSDLPPAPKCVRFSRCPER